MTWTARARGACLATRFPWSTTACSLEVGHRFTTGPKHRYDLRFPGARGAGVLAAVIAAVVALLVAVLVP